MRLFFVFTTMILVSCAKTVADAPNSQVNLRSTEAVLSVFNHTRNIPEAELIGAGSAALRSGATLDAPVALRCWREEESRPIVKNICLLLWAGGGSESEAMEKALRESVGQDKAAGIAAVMRKTPIRSFDAPTLLLLLDSLAQEEPWVRADAVTQWATYHSAGTELSAALAQRVATPPGSGPRNEAASLRALAFLQPGHFHQQLGHYCDAAAKGESRIRCWRFLGTLATYDLPRKYYATFKVFLIPFSDPDWRFFRLNFPAQATAIETYFSKENL